MPEIYSRFKLPPPVSLVMDPEEGQTHQSFKDECDVNLIISRYVKTGSWGSNLAVATRVPQFGDFVGALDFRESMNKIVSAQAEFDALPSKIRNRFHNEPGELLMFLRDEKNRPEAEKLGLVEPKQPAPPKVEPPAAGGGA